MASDGAAVFVGRLDRPDRVAARDLLAEALHALKIALPSGRRVLVQPACPWAHRRLGLHTFTSPVLVEAVARLAARGTVVGTHAMPGVPARYALREAGYGTIGGSAGVVPLDEFPARRLDDTDVPEPAARADVLVAVPHLTGSAFCTFAGAVRHHMFLFPEAVHSAAYPHLPQRMLGLLRVRPPDLIVLDALTVLHRGGEVAGDPLPLSVVVVGTNAVAVDAVAALLYGLEPADVAWLRDAWQAGLGPPAQDVRLLGHLTADDLRGLGRQVIRSGPAPEAYPWPPQIRIVRDPVQPLWNLPAALREAMGILDRGGVDLRRAREAVIVIGQGGRLPPPASDTAAAVLLGDASTADYRGYSRIVRFPGAHVPVIRLVIDLPYVLQAGNLRGELGWSFVGDQLRAALVRRYRAFRRQEVGWPAGYQ